MDDPDWLKLCRDVQAIAQNGLTFCTNPYDIARYTRLQGLAAEMLALRIDKPRMTINEIVSAEVGYATPKIDVRAAVFDEAGRVLMVRETIDNARWTLPGGWADVNLTTAENAVKEVEEESGYRVEPVKLAALWDRARQGHGPEIFSCAKIFYVCRLIGGTALDATDETSGVGWFLENEIPDDLSGARVNRAQVQRMFAHYRDPQIPSDYE